MAARILVGVDGSDPSTRAVEVAAELAARVDSEVLVVHVLRVVYSGASVWTPEMSGAQAKEVVEEAVQTIQKRGVTVRGEVLEAPERQVAKEVLNVAEAEGARLIVIGTTGRSRLESFVLGSTAYRIVHLADRPVLIVP
jgi:nucleotide-binding universal stress UspA family protein